MERAERRPYEKTRYQPIKLFRLDHPAAYQAKDVWFYPPRKPKIHPLLEEWRTVLMAGTRIMQRVASEALRQKEKTADFHFGVNPTRRDFMTHDTSG
jgi:hypothetical protein